MNRLPVILWTLTSLPGTGADLGGPALHHLPLIEIDLSGEALNALRLRECRSAIVTSRWAVAALATVPELARGLSWYAVGEATRQRLEELGIADVAIPPRATSRDLIAWLELEPPAGPVFFPHGNLGGDQVLKFFEAERLAHYSPVVYQTVQRSPEMVQEALPGGLEVLAVVLGSASAAQVWAKLPAQFLADIPIASLGPSTSDACRQAGLEVKFESGSGEIADLMAVLKDNLALRV